jgi:hypothetical protein
MRDGLRVSDSTLGIHVVCCRIAALKCRLGFSATVILIRFSVRMIMQLDFGAHKFRSRAQSVEADTLLSDEVYFSAA